MRRNNFALRLQPSLMEEARKVAESEGVALNQLINVALAEKLSALRTEEYFQERIRRADRAETLRILDRSGKGKAPMECDELPPDLAPDMQRARETSKPTGRAAAQLGKLKKRIEKVRGH
jgi:HicB-like protein involved in pilus formation